MVRRKGPVPEAEYTVPIGRAEVKREGSDVTVFTYGCMVPSARSAAAELEKQGVSAEVFDPRTLHPLDKESLFKSVRKTGRLVTFEEDNGGVGIAVAALVAEEAFDALKAPVRNIHYPNVTIPNCYYGERLLLPKEADLIREVKELMKYRR
jgi:pyruvate dehydrogenase E1 component beta subunit